MSLFLVALVQQLKAHQLGAGCELFSLPCKSETSSHIVDDFKAARHTVRIRPWLSANCEVKGGNVRGSDSIQHHNNQSIH